MRKLQGAFHFGNRCIHSRKYIGNMANIWEISEIFKKYRKYFRTARNICEISVISEVFEKYLKYLRNIGNVWEIYRKYFRNIQKISEICEKYRNNQQPHGNVVPFVRYSRILLHKVVRLEDFSQKLGDFSLWGIFWGFFFSSDFFWRKYLPGE